MGIQSSVIMSIFSCKILIISYKMLIITGISNEKTNELTIYGILCQKHHNILDTRVSFFISGIGKIEIKQEFKIKLLK